MATHSPASAAEIRKAMRALRLAQDPAAAAAGSEAAQRALLASDLWRGAASVGLYAAFRGETDTSLLLRAALGQGKEAFLPRVAAGEAGRMDFVRISGDRDLLPGRFGIPEPRPDLPGLRAHEAALDLVVVPGLAFSTDGFRLGYGGGYYDRFLSVSRVPVRIGLCFSFQVAALPAPMPWDVPMTHLCTEEGLRGVQEILPDKARGREAGSPSGWPRLA